MGVFILFCSFLLRIDKAVVQNLSHFIVEEAEHFNEGCDLWQRCQPLEISNLKIFFSDQHPPPRPNSPMWPPPRKFLSWFGPLTPPLSPTDRFRGKNLDLSVRDFSWWNTHPIRLAYIGVTKKKLSSFCLQRTTCITQENEARNRNTSIRI